MKRGVVVLLLLTWVGCSHTAAAIRRVGGLVVDCRPSDAEVLVNEQYVGIAADFAKRPLSLPVGLVRLELRHEGYFSAYHELHVVEGLRQKLSVALRRRPF